MAGIIDFHSHYIPPEVACHTAFFKTNWSDVDKQISTMDQYGIEKALLFYPSTDAYLSMGGWANVCKIYNQEIANIVKKHSDRFIGAGILPFDKPDEIILEANRAKDLGLRIFSLASSYEGIYLDDERFFSLYDFCAHKKMPIHVHPQIICPIGEERVKDPLLSPVLEYMFDVSMCIGKMMMNNIFKNFSDTKFIFAHYGGVIPFLKERFDNTYQMLRGRNFVKDLGSLPSAYFKNLYFDTSGSQSSGALLCALESVDSQHILFGSDYPANQRLGDSIDMIRQSNLSSIDQERILSLNALDLI